MKIPQWLIPLCLAGLALGIAQAQEAPNRK